MQICFLCDEYPPGPHGGIGTLTQTLARAFAAAGHRVRVVGVYPPSYPGAREVEDMGVRVQRLAAATGAGGWLRSRLQLFRMIARWARQGDIDVVEVPDWQGGAAKWPRLPVPVVARLSGSASYFAAELGQRVKRSTFWLERESLRRADFWIAESRYAAEKTRDVFRFERPFETVIYNPVELPSQTSQEPRSANRVVFAGTLTEKKGVRSLARAWPLVRKKIPSAELVMFGKDGRTATGDSMRRELESELSASGAGGVSFQGHVGLESLLEAFRTARAVVLPSSAEGFALTPLHSMACGCPTIYTRRGSGPEVIEDGRTGLLVDPDDPEEIAGAIARLLSDDDLARRLGETGLQEVRRRFSLEAVMPQNEAFYRESLARFSQSRGAA